MALKKNPGFLLLIPLLVAVLSCSAEIEGMVREGGAADLTLKSSLGPRTIALIRSLQDFMGAKANPPGSHGGQGSSGVPILDGPAISRSMAAAPGVRSVSLQEPRPAGQAAAAGSALDGTISLSNVGDFLSGTGVNGLSAAKFITYSEGKSAGSSSIVVTLDKDRAPDVISRLSPEVGDYLNALMAPVVLGECSTKQEYLDLLTQVYGRSLSDEIAAAHIRAAIEFNRPITAVQGGSGKGKKAEFDIPLVDLLVLEKPLVWEISW